MDEHQSRPKSLSNDELSEFIFDVLKIQETDCIGLDYFYGHKEIELKEGVVVSPYLYVDHPITFHDFDIIVKKARNEFCNQSAFQKCSSQCS